MPLLRRGVGTYPETSSHSTRQRTLGHSRLSSLSPCGLILWHKVALKMNVSGEGNLARSLYSAVNRFCISSGKFLEEKGFIKNADCFVPEIDEKLSRTTLTCSGQVFVVVVVVSFFVVVFFNFSPPISFGF